jgi:hypothetical protein
MSEAKGRNACVAIVGPIADRQQTIHSWIRDGSKRFMPFPEVVWAEGEMGSVMLYRCRSDGEFCGDTWHASIKEAQDQAQYEYGPALGRWHPIPADVPDALQYAIAFARENRVVKP